MTHQVGDELFTAERPRLVGLAYRMLGSLTEAEDVVQDAWLRWQRAAPGSVERPAAWLTTVTSRLAIDRLRAQRRRREEYVGPWLPEPVVVAAAPGDGDPSTPEGAAVRAESLQLGFLVVLDTLGPVERVVFILSDVFSVPFAEIAEAVGRSPEACRQLASRARRKVIDQRGGRRPVDEGLLAPGVVLTSDGGPNRHAARRPVVLPDRVARLLVNLAARVPADGVVGIEEVNCSPALVIRGVDTLVLSAERDAMTGAIDRLCLVVNPDKLAGLDRPVQLC
jgi:RNA polymerase sigma-70 factor (ECF subfamily)